MNHVQQLERGLGYVPEPEGHLDDLCGVNRDAAQLVSADGAIAEQNTLLLQYIPPFKDQYTTNTCVAASLANAAEARLASRGQPVPPSSIRQPYTLANMMLRKTKGEQLYDIGTYPRMVMQVAAEWGVATDAAWPLVHPETGEMLSPTEEVPPDVLQAASSWKLTEQSSIYAQGDERVRIVCASLDLMEPVLAPGKVDRLFERFDGRGVLTAHNDDVIGGHQVAIIGYRRNPFNRGFEFLLVNQWNGWGFEGLPGTQVRSLAWADADWLKSRDTMFRIQTTRVRATS